MIEHNFSSMEADDYKFVLNTLYTDSNPSNPETVIKLFNIFKKYNPEKSTYWSAISTVVNIYSTIKNLDWVADCTELGLSNNDIDALQFIYDVSFYDFNRYNYEFVTSHPIIGEGVDSLSPNGINFDVKPITNIASYAVDIIEDSSVKLLLKLIIGRIALNLTLGIRNSAEAEIDEYNKIIANFIISADNEYIKESNEILMEVSRKCVR